VPEVPAQAGEILDAVTLARASNSWVIGPALSRSGKPILANDPHLMLRAPSLWYLAAIESPGFHVAGATIPGLPAVILGHNRRIAWGFTNIEADDVDYVIERLTRDSARVLTPAGWAVVEAVRDSIRVRGRPAAPFVLRRTSHGPLVPRSGVTGPPRGDTIEAVAMRWNAHDPSDELTAMLDVDRAGSWAELLAAVARFKVPEQNWVYADVDGNIGYTASGAIPVRRSGTGALPTPGWTDEGRWERYLDFDELPRALNPRDGFIVTANNRVSGPEYPWMLSQNWGPPYRAARIRELILRGGAFTADDVRAMQLDTLDAFARWARSLAASAAEAAGRADLAGALRSWDGTMGADRPEPVLFTIWYRTLQRLTFQDELDGYAPASPLHAWLGAGGSPWFDDVRTPDREDLAAVSLRAMRAAIPTAEGRRWGDVHVTVARHALGSSRPLQLLLRLNFGPQPRAGSLYTVNVAEFGGFVPPFVNTHAASLRHVVDMGDPEAGMFIITTGQSGNPLSRRYRDQEPLWRRGLLWTVPLSAARVAAVGTLRLVPGGR
jgi:penicillin amidase